MVGGRKIVPFNNKLDGARAGGVAALAAANNPAHQQNLDDVEGAIGGIHGEEGCVGEPPIAEPPLSLLCSPAKRTSLPDSWKLLPDTTNWSLWTSQEGQSGAPAGGSSGLTSTQLHRQLMALRLQRRAGVVEPPGK